MKLNKRFLGFLCFNLILIEVTPLLASVPLARMKRNQIRCEAIGRILNRGDRHLSPGSLVCSGEKLEVLNGKYINLICFSSGEVLKLSSGVIAASECAKPSLSNSTCNSMNVENCLIRKGGTPQAEEPTIIYPYTSSILNSRPDIAWQPVNGATYYKVRLSGYEFEWEKIVNQTKLTYPPSEKELQFDQAFKITVIAYKNDSPLAADTFVVNLFSQSEIKQVLDTVEQIKSLDLPEDETALDLDAVYMSRGFLDESIEELTKAATTNSKNPTLYRVLGERYFEAGLPNEAKRQFVISAQLANNTNNSTELKKVEQGLRLIDFYNQLPTSKKGAQ
ncbi:tetratricopeptide repeat protein [Desmonostoc muscorum]|uniref:tetratricopeptide repeat protein n=1 Tax=Desmonostoc muscorum TaxID=1179 RepID=UPI001F25F8C6|nr:hypothetical protein [Desmonostoc muscorum]